MSCSLTIGRALFQHLDALKILADRHRNEIGFLNRAKLREAIEVSRMLVVVSDDQPIGFVIYRHRKRDSQTTLSEICIASEWRQQGVGRMLIEQLIRECQMYARTEVLLKCPVDLSANEFYRHVGFKHIAIEQGRKRQLNIWRLDVP